MNTKSTWSNMLQQKAVTAKPQGNYELKHLEHVGHNPMFASHVAKAFKVTPAKVKMNQPGDFEVGSPWESMGRKK